ncbi:O-antigen ligase C-terminal domain-containing protein [Moritella sp. 24]|uniref:PglL family O-oligosaccharyltransferase n=1 Tax=Moritella sp. 24 TaxID=2746230 RepID=UPI001BA9B2B3|nr:Wzy polymerase domain-containing protein [Moritella sp. 24]QUM78289.1 O-antigen ligase C-terminal domain-containing protein [Moritella sp. 24]
MNLTTLKKGFFITFAVYMLIGMHYFQHNGGGSGLHLPFNVIGWIFISALIGIGLWQATVQAKLVYSRLSLLFIAATTVMLIPVLYADPIVAGLSYTRLLGLVGGLLFFIALQQLQLSQKQRLTLLYLILGAVFIEAYISLVQYYLLPVNNIFGYQKIANRPYGIFQQPNVSASFLTTGIALALYLLTQTKLDEKRKRRFCYVTTFMAVIPLVLLQSRTGYLSLLIASLLLLPWVWLQLRESGQLKSLFIWLACCAIAIAIGAYSLEAAKTVARSTAYLTDPGARMPIYQHALAMLLDKPLLGWGYGSFEVEFLNTYSQALNQGLVLPGSPENLDHPHNELLYWGIEGGLVSLAGIALLIVGFLRIIVKQPLWQALALLGLVFPLVLHSQTEYPFYHSIVHWVVFLTLVWYIASRYGNTKTIAFKYTFLLRTLALLIPLVTTAFMVTTLHTNKLLTQYERSDRSDITPLTKVINPVAWISRLEFNAMMYRLQIAMYNNDIAELNNYINWANEISKKTPRANIYINWSRALAKLGQQQAADKLLQQTAIMYPRNELVQKFAASQAGITQ